MELSYRDMIDGINAGKFDEVHFSVQGYAHYRHCVLRRVYRHTAAGGRSFECIELALTKDRSEMYTTYGPFEDREKVINIPGRGRYTIREMFPRIDITDIIYRS